MEGERIVVELEADCYILQNDGDYKVSYSVLGLHRRGCTQEDCLSILAQDVYSQHELEYLNDCVRPSEWWAGQPRLSALHGLGGLLRPPAVPEPASPSGEGEVRIFDRGRRFPSTP